MSRCAGVSCRGERISPLVKCAGRWARAISSSSLRAQPRRALALTRTLTARRLFRPYFRNGQVIETFRGGAKGGIYQPAVDIAIDKLRDGQWVRGESGASLWSSMQSAQVHIFPEGKVNQDPLAKLLRFRWGVSRMLLEAGDDVEVVPMWIQGAPSRRAYIGLR